MSLRHVRLDPLKRRQFHLLKTQTELYLAKARLELSKNKQRKAYKHLFDADMTFTKLQLFIMICESAFFTTDEDYKD